jgi:adenosylcobinamide kinase/adenosylcobinamide-phosphate guanylyltransferase
MRLAVVTGGARSGKSRWAQDRALALGGDHVTVVATASAGDEEMARRIARHRAERRPTWTTIEAPREAGRAVGRATTDVVVLDCLTVLLGNTIDVATAARGEDAALAAMTTEVDGLLAAARTRTGTLIVVTNEAGLGVHPPTEIGRWFRDGLGTANQRLVAAADEVVLMVAGLELRLK